MNAQFIEFPAFERHRAEYLDDDGYRALQNFLMASPTAGDLIEGTGGLRKLRFTNARRRKGKRGGLRVIYYVWEGGSQFWLFTIYDKDTMDDLSSQQRKTLRAMIKSELRSRRQP